MSIRIIPAIMSGGAGARLWPVSTESAPKQFHALAGEPRSLFAETAARLRGAFDEIAFSDPIVLCNEAHLALVREHLALAAVTPAAVVLEPCPRNTAAVGAVAAAVAAEIDSGALVLLTPSDHIIRDAEGFRAIIARAAPFARERIVTFGIAPDRPATGYGYIRRGTPLADGVFAVDSFREKPDAATAQGYLDDGGYSWNAGIFLFSPALMLQEFNASAEVRAGALAALAAAKRIGDEIRLDGELFEEILAEPLDTAVMEKTKHAAVAPCDIGWADLGAWDEIWRLSPKDADGNVVRGAVVALDAAQSVLHAEGVTLCAAGVDGLIIIATPQAVIVLPKERAQDVKRLKELAQKL